MEDFPEVPAGIGARSARNCPIAPFAGDNLIDKENFHNADDCRRNRPRDGILSMIGLFDEVHLF